MKSLFQHMLDILFIIILFFTFAGLIKMESDIKEARDVLASTVEAVQSSYYDEETIEKLNNQLHQNYPDTWRLSIVEIDSVSTRRNYMVILHYEVKMPFFGIKKSGELKSYAR